MKPSRIEYHIGKDAFGRQVRLVFTKEYGWEVHREAGDQRDTSERVTGLTWENLVAIAEAAKGTNKA
jgi:hypothetical protein